MQRGHLRPYDMDYGLIKMMEAAVVVVASSTDPNLWRLTQRVSCHLSAPAPPPPFFCRWSTGHNVNKWVLWGTLLWNQAGRSSTSVCECTDAGPQPSEPVCTCKMTNESANYAAKKDHAAKKENNEIINYLFWSLTYFACINISYISILVSDCIFPVYFTNTS